MVGARRRARWRRRWDRQAPRYDRAMGLAERYWFGDTREWVCSRARGRVLEVAVGTGLNLPHYPTGARVTGVDVSDAMLRQARDRAGRLGRPVGLRLADAEALPFNEAAFDSVVCTFSLCAIPDPVGALAEMQRVLRPGGWLLLADHIVSTAPALRGAQRLVELVSVPLSGEHFLRRPSALLAPPMRVRDRDRFARGTLERLVAQRCPVSESG